MDLSYDKEQTARAKVEGLHLITLDIKGKYAKRDGVMYQGFLFTEEEVEEAYKFFEWLTSKRKSLKEGNEPDPT